MWKHISKNGGFDKAPLTPWPWGGIPFLTVPFRSIHLYVAFRICGYPPVVEPSTTEDPPPVDALPAKHGTF